MWENILVLRFLVYIKLILVQAYLQELSFKYYIYVKGLKKHLLSIRGQEITEMPGNK